MTKRILSFVVVLAMLLSVLPVQMVGAEVAAHGHSDAHTCSEQCPGGTVTWKPWGKTNGNSTTIPTTSGHYYLECDLSLTARNDIPAGADVTICLNGYNITETGSGNVSYVSGYLTISDCTAHYDAEENYIAGAITGCKASDGGCFNVRRGGKLTLESGKLTGNTVTGGGGAVSLQSKNSSMTGGLFYMYGGEISNNTAPNGGAVMANNGGQFYMYGGVIEKNYGSSNGKEGGGAVYLYGSSSAVIKDGTIRDNTARQNKDGVTAAGIYMIGADVQLTVGGSTVIDDLYFNNAAGCLQVDGLQEGSRITMTTVDPAKTAAELVKLAQGGTQTEWDSKWLTVNDQVVSLGDDGFVYGPLEPPVVHTHCQDGKTDCGHTQENWTAWDKTDSLPTEAGSYFLTGTVSLKAAWQPDADIKLCLNGYSVKKVDALTSRVINIPAGVTLTVTNCQNAGSVTGGTGINIHRGTATKAGGVLNLYAGKLTGFSSSEGVIYMQSGKVDAPGGTFNLYGGEISGNTAKTGGIVCVKGETAAASQGSPATFHLYGGKISDNTVTEQGGGVYAIGKATVNILGGEISGNTTAGNGGGIYATEGATLDLKNTQISGNTAAGQGGGIYANKNCTVTIENSAIQSNTSTKDGGGAYLHTVNATLKNIDVRNNTSKASGCGLGFGGASVATVTGGQIAGNSGPNGAGMIAQGTSQVTMAGVTVDGNASSSYAGGVYVNSGAKVTMDKACVLTNNTATKYGGAVYGADNATVELNGAQLKNNQASQGGGVFALAKANITLSGPVLIQGNQGGNLQLSGGLITVQDMQEGAAVQVTAAAGVISQPCQDLAQYFTSDSAYQMVVYKEGALHITVADKYYHKHCLCAAAAEGCDHSNVEWGIWDRTDALPTSGCYYLLYDVVLTGEISVTGDLTLCLNGKTVTAAANKRIFSTPKNTEVTINVTDCKETGKLTGGVDVAKETGGGAIFIRAKGTLNWYGGTITGNKSITAGGAILLAGDATFRLYGGEISGNGARDEGVFINGGAIFGMAKSQIGIYGGKIANNTGKNGGAIYTDGALTIAGGEISGNTASSQGGGVYAKAGDLVVSGGLIENNVSVKDGGGLYYRQGKAALSGGTVRENSSAASGGGYAFSGSAQVTMTGGTITGNVSPNGGGMIVQGGASLAFSDGQVIGNTSTGTAGGVYIADNSSINMTGGTIADNTAAGTAGGITVTGGTGSFSGGAITGNTAQKDGGGLYVRLSQTDITGQILISGNRTVKGAGGGVCYSKTSTGKISGGTVEKNQAANGGGMIFQGNASVEITGVTVKNNTADNAGGGIYVNNSTLKFSGGTVTGNRTNKGTGGGVFSAGTSVTTITGGTFSYNVSQKDGGGVYNNKGTMRLSGMIITGNQSVKGAGGGLGSTKEGRLIMTGGSVVYNKAGNAAGVIIQSKAHFEMYGGTIGYNEGNSGAGLYVNNASADLQGGTIIGNIAQKNGGGGYCYNSKITMSPNFTVQKNESVNQYAGGMYFNLGTLDISGTKFVENKSKGGGTGFYTFKTECKIRDVYVADNVTTNSSSGGVCLSRETKFDWEGGIIENNYATNGGGGILIQNWAEGTAKGLIIRNNTSKEGGGGLFCYTCVDATFVDCQIYGNKNETGGGGGVFLSTPRAAFDPASYVNFIGCDIYDNRAGGTGGGVYISKQMVTTWTDCKIEGNESGDSGGGMYALWGTDTTLDNVKVLGNKSALTGSGLYIDDNLTLHDVTVTGNQAKEGAAVYLPVNEYDGESYQRAYHTFSGDIIIADNQGTQDDLYIGAGTAIGTTTEGLGKNTRIVLELETGILTNTLLAAYDYEGGDLHYTVTYGDRSTREPEYEQPKTEAAAQEQEKTETGDILLYAGIGVIGLAAIAGAVLLILKKKKKPAKAEN